MVAFEGRRIHQTEIRIFESLAEAEDYALNMPRPKKAPYAGHRYYGPSVWLINSTDKPERLKSWSWDAKQSVWL